MRIKLLAAAATGLLALGMTTACNDSSGSSDASSNSGTVTGGGAAHIGVILPDKKSSARWVQDDPIYLANAFKAAGVTADIENANGDVSNFTSIADKMINSGVTVLMIVNLDSDSGKAVLAKAKAKGIKTIDYDRLTLGGGADYYVSFNNEKVGVLQANALETCMGLGKTSTPSADPQVSSSSSTKDASSGKSDSTSKSHSTKSAGPPFIAELNGSPTDNNATQFKEGYDSVLQPLYDSGVALKGPDQSVANWDAAKGTKIFQQMLQQQPHIAGVLAANDGLGDAAIQVLKQAGLNKKVPVTGQDATTVGLQHILAGDQCMTVYKSVKTEAQKAADAAVALFKKATPAGFTSTVKDPTSGAYVTSELLDPQAITSAQDIQNIVIKDGYVSAKELCTGVYAGICQNDGIH